MIQKAYGIGHEWRCSPEPAQASPPRPSTRTTPSSLPRSPSALAFVRLLLALYALCTLCTALALDGGASSGASFLSFCTQLCYIGLAAYLVAAGVQTAATHDGAGGKLTVVVFRASPLVFPLRVAKMGRSVHRDGGVLGAALLTRHLLYHFLCLAQHLRLFTLLELLLTNAPPALLALPVQILLVGAYLYYEGEPGGLPCVVLLLFPLFFPFAWAALRRRYASDASDARAALFQSPASMCPTSSSLRLNLNLHLLLPGCTPRRSIACGAPGSMWRSAGVSDGPRCVLRPAPLRCTAPFFGARPLLRPRTSADCVQTARAPAFLRGPRLLRSFFAQPRRPRCRRWCGPRAISVLRIYPASPSFAPGCLYGLRCGLRCGEPRSVPGAASYIMCGRAAFEFALFSRVSRTGPAASECAPVLRPASVARILCLVQAARSSRSAYLLRGRPAFFFAALRSVVVSPRTAKGAPLVWPTFCVLCPRA
ncbi:hypothetical protein FB451DRAFT_1392698 [Mycena latifolia]|nr:hypothetical protein FB451DRAFT_1392698 [Mycena latifolia]